MDEEVFRAPGPVQAGHALPLQFARHIHALGDGAESDWYDRTGLPAPEALRSAGFPESKLGGQPTGDIGRRLWIFCAHGRNRTLRTIVSSERPMAGTTTRPCRLGRASDVSANLKRFVS